MLGTAGVGVRLGVWGTTLVVRKRSEDANRRRVVW